MAEEKGNSGLTQEVESLKSVSKNLAELLTNSVNMVDKYYEIFFDQNPHYVELEQYDKNGILHTTLVPNRAMDKSVALSGNEDPEGVVDAVIGALYINSATRELFMKKTTKGNIGWVNITPQPIEIYKETFKVNSKTETVSLLYKVYAKEYVDVFLNGIHLEQADFDLGTNQQTLIFNTQLSDDSTLQVSYMTGLYGIKGDTALTFKIGEVRTVPTGEIAKVENVGTNEDIVLDFDIPKGVGVTAVELISTVGLVKTYRMRFSDNTYFDYDVTDGDIQGLDKEQIVAKLGFEPASYTSVEDLTNVVNTKQDKLTAGENITIENNTISAKSGGLPIGSEVMVPASSGYVPKGCLLKDGSEYTKEQFPDLWENYLSYDVLLSEWTTQKVGSNSYKAITYGNNTFVAVGFNGLISTSSDGTNWTTKKVGSDYLAITYGNNTFVAVGNSGQISTSSDGTNWTTKTVGSDYLAITYGNNTFVAVGSNGLISTSSDGTNWTTQTVGSDCEAITYGNNTFVAVGFSGQISTSSDGTNWTTKTVGSDYLAITYGNNTFVAVGSNGLISTSSDGTNWTTQTVGSTNYQAITYANNMFVAVGSNGLISTSSDGTNWTTQTVGSTNYQAITYANNMFVAVGNSARISTSSDGTNWTTQKVGSNSYEAITYGNNTFVAVGSNGQISIIKSTITDTALSSITYTDYETQVSKFGVCESFGIDMENGKFKVPYKTSSSAGKYYVAVANAQVNQSQMDWSAWASSLQGKANTDLSNLSDIGSKVIDGKANTDLSNLSDIGSKVIDGKWVNRYAVLATATPSPQGSTQTFSLSKILPNDGNIYEIIIGIDVSTAASSGSIANIFAYTDAISSKLPLVKVVTRASSAAFGANTCNLIVGAERKLSLYNSSDSVGTSTYNLELYAYRRVRS